MSARHRIPTPRTVRRAVDVLAQLGPDVLAELAEAVIDRLDAAGPDPDGDLCSAEDMPLAYPHTCSGGSGTGDQADAEPSLGWAENDGEQRHSSGCTGADLEEDRADDEDDGLAEDSCDDEDETDMGASEDEPIFHAPGSLRAERDGLVTVHRRPVIVTTYNASGKPLRVRTMLARRFA